MTLHFGKLIVAFGVSIIIIAWPAGARADGDEPTFRAYFGTSAGPLWISSEAGERTAVGDGFKIDFTLGTALWDQLALNAGVGYSSSKTSYHSRSSCSAA